MAIIALAVGRRSMSPTPMPRWRLCALGQKLVRIVWWGPSGHEKTVVSALIVHRTELGQAQTLTEWSCWPVTRKERKGGAAVGLARQLAVEDAAGQSNGS